MKLGLELSPAQLDLEHYRFARECGCTHLALQLPAGFQAEPSMVCEAPASSGYAGTQSVERDPGSPLAYEDLARLTEEVNAAELQVEAIGSADPRLHLDIPRDRAGRARSLENLRATIRSVGEAGIPVFIYQVSPQDAVAPAPGQAGARRGSPRTRRHLEACLAELTPVAEEAGVTLAAQPMEPLFAASDRGTAAPGRRKLVFSVGDMAAAQADVYAALETCSRRGSIACVRLDNVRGTGRQTHASFVDDGDVDVRRVVHILRRTGYGGLIVPGRVPWMSCAAPWHAATAHALGYLRAVLAATSDGAE